LAALPHSVFCCCSQEKLKKKGKKKKGKGKKKKGKDEL